MKTHSVSALGSVFRSGIVFSLVQRLQLSTPVQQICFSQNPFEDFKSHKGSKATVWGVSQNNGIHMTKSSSHSPHKGKESPLDELSKQITSHVRMYPGHTNHLICSSTWHDPRLANAHIAKFHPSCLPQAVCCWPSNIFCSVNSSCLYTRPFHSHHATLKQAICLSVRYDVPRGYCFFCQI